MNSEDIHLVYNLYILSACAHNKKIFFYPHYFINTPSVCGHFIFDFFDTNLDYLSYLKFRIIFYFNYNLVYYIMYFKYTFDFYIFGLLEAFLICFSCDGVSTFFYRVMWHICSFLVMIFNCHLLL
jgi:hypothetical protein